MICAFCRHMPHDRPCGVTGCNCPPKRMAVRDAPLAETAALVKQERDRLALCALRGFADGDDVASA